MGKRTTLYRRKCAPWCATRPRRTLPRSAAEYVYRVRPNLTLLLSWRPWFGIWLSATWHSAWTHLAPTVAYPKPETSVKKKNVASSPVNDRVHLAAVESKLFGGLHPLIAHCATTKYDDGDPRKPGWFTVGTTGSSWTFTVKDPDSCMSFRVVAPTIDDAFTLASLMLEAEETPWEHDAWLVSQGKAKKK